MSNSRLLINGRPARLHGSLTSPRFMTRRVLCSDPFAYVAMWLRREKMDAAIHYWEQARHFHKAALSLPQVSSPLLHYYSILNSTKALLAAKNQSYAELHGLSGKRLPGKTCLSNEIIEFKSGGVLAALARLLDEPNNAGTEYNLKQILWAMPFIHRAFCLTFSAAKELFIPLRDVCFYRKDGTEKCWVQAEIEQRYINAQLDKTLGTEFQRFKEVDGTWIIRSKKTFRWATRQRDKSLIDMGKYHRKVRKRIVPIYASENRWYLRKTGLAESPMENSRLYLIYAAMHRLSELSRYDPLSLTSHFSMRHNWLLAEFLENAPDQFIYGIASEITGSEFLRPDRF